MNSHPTLFCFTIEKKDMATPKKGKKITEPVSIESQERLMEIMNNSPKLVRLAGTEWEIHALKPGTKWLIAEEAVKIAKKEDMTMKDIFVSVSQNMPSVVRILTLALLNDKERIDRDYQTVYDTLMWESDDKDWANLLFEVFSLIDVGFFFQILQSTQIFREMTLKRKMMKAEREQLSQGQNGEK